VNNDPGPWTLDPGPWTLDPGPWNNNSPPDDRGLTRTPCPERHFPQTCGVILYRPALGDPVSEPLAETLVRMATFYFGVGLVFAIPFAWRWAARLDPVAREGTGGFRLLLLPGGVLLWPWLALRLLQPGPHPPEERNAHRRARDADRP